MEDTKYTFISEDPDGARTEHTFIEGRGPEIVRQFYYFMLAGSWMPSQLQKYMKNTAEEQEDFK